MESEVDQLFSRAISLYEKFSESEDMNYIDEAIDLCREAQNSRLYPPTHPTRPTALNFLAGLLATRYKWLGRMQDLDEAITLDREATALCPHGHPGRSMSLRTLADHLSDRFRQLGGLDDIDEAIVLSREALDLCPQGHLHRQIFLITFALQLSARYKQFGGMQDLGEAIDLSREAIALCPRDHPHRSTSLNNLAACLSSRYQRLGEIHDVDEAIILGREALDLCPQRHPGRSTSLNTLASLLATRYRQLGAMQDLNEAIVLEREALDIHSQGHPSQIMTLHNLTSLLSRRYEQLGGMQDVDEAIVFGQEALDICPQGHLLRPILLNTLGMQLSIRYKRLGSMQDLDEAIVLEREALVLSPRGHSERPKFLNNLACLLSTQYEQFGAIQVLDEAIVLDREALDLCSRGHPDRSATLDNLAVHLRQRYIRLGTMQDLDEAIVLDKEALDLRPQGHPDRSMSLSNLASILFMRYKQLSATEDLNEAIVLGKEAIDLRPLGHPDRPTSLSNLSTNLSARYKQFGEIQDLNDAIDLDREALDLRPQGHPDRSISLNNLAACLSARYERLVAMEDLEEAIDLGRSVLDLCSLGHYLRSQSLANLAWYLSLRFTCLKQLEDKEEMFNLYTELADLSQIVSSSDLSAARNWVRAAADLQHPTLLLAYETSLRLLVQHLVTLPSLPQHLGILKDLTSSLAVDAFSVCLQNQTPTHAVELLEQGRGVFWSQLSRLHSPLEDVIESGSVGKTLGEEFMRLATLTRSVLNSPGTDQHGRLFSLNIEMEKIVTDIRKLPGLSRFLLPPLFSDLRHAASEGPVIIVNASKNSCDALVIFLDQDPVHIPLRITQEDVRDLSTELGILTRRATRMDMTREFASFLRRLWDQIVSPIIDFILTVHPSQSRIWWCPTGEFSALPLHAAGPFRKGERNLPSIYVSSYTPTLTALIRARRQNPSNPASKGKHFVAIGQANAVDQRELPSVGAELDNISQCVSSLATFTRVDGEESCIGRVVKELGKNEWVHFACHGLPNPKQPFESAFALRDGHFTIQQIIGCDLKNPEFAYLSACHTTVGYEESPDEVIHLASAMQFVGFRSVIGTMWAVDDRETNKIISTFYKYMVDESGHLDHTRAAVALSRTMRSVHVPLDQRILYIHLGA